MKALVKKSPEPGSHLHILVVKELSSLKYVLVSASYAPAHDHPNALLMDFQGPTVDCCAAETLQKFVEGPGPLVNLDDVGDTAGGIVRQWK